MKGDKKKIKEKSLLKNFIFFLINPSLLIPAICIISLVYYTGNSEFKWFKDYKEYSLNVCTRTFEPSYDTIIKGPKKLSWFVICGMREVPINKFEIENNNLPGVISTSQEDISANIKVKMKCYEESKCSDFRQITCRKEVTNYGKTCEIEKLTEMNNGPEFFKLNPDYEKYLKITGKLKK